MKKNLLTILSGILILGSTGCGINKNEFTIGEKSNIKLEEKGVSFSVKKNTLTRTGAKFILKNNSDIDVEYGNPYEMEIKKSGEWHKVNVAIDFTMPSFKLKSKEMVEIDLNWEHGYGNLAIGNYRIIKDINIEQKNGTFETFYVSAEFTIE